MIVLCIVVQINFRVLFRLLEPKVIIEIFNAMLCEVSVLLLADSVDELTPCLEALNALLHPMKWPFVYVPVLPLSLVGAFFLPLASQRICMQAPFSEIHHLNYLICMVIARRVLLARRVV